MKKKIEPKKAEAKKPIAVAKKEVKKVEPKKVEAKKLIAVAKKTKQIPSAKGMKGIGKSLISKKPTVVAKKQVVKVEPKKAEAKKPIAVSKKQAYKETASKEQVISHYYVGGASITMTAIFSERPTYKQVEEFASLLLWGAKNKQLTKMDKKQK
jgi:hypothetical protein